MLSRKALDNLFAELPALLVARCNLTADQAQDAAENCLIEDKVSDKLFIHTYTPDNQAAFLFTYETSLIATREGRDYVLLKVERLMMQGKMPCWEVL